MRLCAATAEIQLSHVLGVPGHMVLDKDSGYSLHRRRGSQPGAYGSTPGTRPTTSTDTMQSGFDEGLEALAQEYSRNCRNRMGSPCHWTRPAFWNRAGWGPTVCFSQWQRENRSVRFELRMVKVQLKQDTIQTSASSIMGLEIGPNGHLYYVDNGQDEVVRIDPFTDGDGDGVGDEIDNCPFIANSAQANYDGDANGDICDEDDDNDGVLDLLDDCALGNLTWVAAEMGIGYFDLTEDVDDDNDGILDVDELFEERPCLDFFALF